MVKWVHSLNFSGLQVCGRVPLPYVQGKYFHRFITGYLINLVKNVDPMDTMENNYEKGVPKSKKKLSVFKIFKNTF